MWKWLASNLARVGTGPVIGHLHPSDLPKLLSGERIWMREGRCNGAVVETVIMTCMDCRTRWETNKNCATVEGEWIGCPVCLGIYDMAHLTVGSAS